MRLHTPNTAANSNRVASGRHQLEPLASPGPLEGEGPENEATATIYYKALATDCTRHSCSHC